MGRRALRQRPRPNERERARGACFLEENEAQKALRLPVPREGGPGRVAEPLSQEHSLPPGAAGTGGEARCCVTLSGWVAGRARVESGRAARAPPAHRPQPPHSPAPAPTAPRTQDAEMSGKVTGPARVRVGLQPGSAAPGGSCGCQVGASGLGVTGFSHQCRAAPHRPSDRGSPDRPCLGRGQSCLSPRTTAGKLLETKRLSPVGGFTRNSQRDCGQEGEWEPSGGGREPRGLVGTWAGVRQAARRGSPPGLCSPGPARHGVPSRVRDLVSENGLGVPPWGRGVARPRSPPRLCAPLVPLCDVRCCPSFSFNKCCIVNVARAFVCHLSFPPDRVQRGDAG